MTIKADPNSQTYSFYETTGQEVFHLSEEESQEFAEVLDFAPDMTVEDYNSLSDEEKEEIREVVRAICYQYLPEGAQMPSLDGLDPRALIALLISLADVVSKKDFLTPKEMARFVADALQIATGVAVAGAEDDEEKPDKSKTAIGFQS